MSEAGRSASMQNRESHAGGTPARTVASRGKAARRRVASTTLPRNAGVAWAMYQRRSSPPQRWTKVDLCLKGRPALGDQVITGIQKAPVGRFVALYGLYSSVLGLGDNKAGNFQFLASRPLCQLFEPVPVPVACDEIHLGEEGIGAENFVHQADLFEEGIPGIG